ncbi:hypothetical protein Sfr7A_11425 [Streptomyces xinghaiensis]|uniref:Uncharacterized protein n=1 Tax=Streptomyces xinghaiensis TaxID=1038928 RepID=A0A3R7I0Y4_9ACTN|nr:hypothetical protein BEN35_28680 [Streptomyces fradiae]PQM23199.1 hypothetical protein Sfr7A_11425 [Streptomyces xinghaiensis]RKM94760.1 hypothetical protein SFRA_015885 [Streptomyces xinghaiensis]RNC74799.1 hypothetical protein DC095_009065 [Streptomyces xinghaiensis]
MEELALGFEDPAPRLFHALFLGRPGESAVDRAARLSVARDVLAELREQGADDDIVRQDAEYAHALLRLTLLGRRPVAGSAPADSKGEAA